MKKITEEYKLSLFERHQQYYIKNKEVIKEKKKIYYETNKDKIKSKNKLRRKGFILKPIEKLHQKNEEILNRKLALESIRHNIEKIEHKQCSRCKETKSTNNFGIKYKKEACRYSNQCKKCVSELNKTYRENNKEKLKLKNKAYKESNKELFKERRMLYNRNKIKSDVLFKLKLNTRCLINNSFLGKDLKKKLKTEEILGCTFEYFKNHLESKFEPWMTWDNKGLYNGTPNFGWDVDHVVPLITAKTEKEIIDLNHYTNLQPLCSYLNRDVKKDKY